MPIEIQIKIIATLTIIGIAVVCYQLVRLGRFVRNVTGGQSGFIKVRIGAWTMLLASRLIGLASLSEQVTQAKAAGVIKESLSWSQWASLGGFLLFLFMVILSKHKERNSITKAWGEEKIMADQKENKDVVVEETKDESSSAANTTISGTGSESSESDGDDRSGVGSSPGDKPTQDGGN